MGTFPVETVRSLIAEYLGEHISTAEFANAFDVAAWDASRLAPADAAIRGDAYLALAEFSLGHMDEAELRDELRSLIPDPVMVVHSGESHIARSDSDNVTHQTARRFLGRQVTFGTPRVLVPA